MMLRLLGDPDAVPYDLREAFRTFGAGEYRSALESVRPWSYDSLLEDDRRSGPRLDHYLDSVSGGLRRHP